MKQDKEFRSLSISMESESRTAHRTIPYNTRSEYMGFWEILAPGCFTKTLQQSRSIRVLIEHDDRKLISRTDNGSLRIVDTPTALEADFDIPNTTEGNDLLEMIRTGLTNGASFGFICMKEDYRLESGEEVRTVLEARLLELSVVLSEPAYSASKVFMRSLSSALEGKETLTEDEQKAAQAEIEKLQSLLPKTEPEGPSIEEAKQEQARVEAELKAKVEAEIMQKKATEEELKAQEEAKAEAEEMQKLYERLEAASKILCGETA